MAASMKNDIQIDNNLNSQSEPSVNTTDTGKRSALESPDQLPATQKQTLRQTRKRNSNSVSTVTYQIEYSINLTGFGTIVCKLST
jgi:hypothetical protein